MYLGGVFSEMLIIGICTSVKYETVAVFLQMLVNTKEINSRWKLLT